MCRRHPGPPLGDHHCRMPRIVSLYLVITAIFGALAFIFSENPDLWRVYAGDDNLNGNGTLYTIADFAIHEGYFGFVSRDNNIALIKVSLNILYSIIFQRDD